MQDPRTYLFVRRYQSTLRFGGLTSHVIIINHLFPNVLIIIIIIIIYFVHSSYCRVKWVKKI
ncbi:hypothetical protein ACJRO7_034065 [Eucalyptus globulus]|uniref:Uncharacterized protein n=1 Tax=Eucalyptus globulus TaxID=34317 RepID=A0ABD3J579_EUCGL